MTHRKSAFTLVEMLVVIGVIAFMSVGIAMLNMSDSTQSIYSAQRSMMLSFYEARSTALAKQTDVAVVIYKGDDKSRCLRQVGVMYRDRDTDGNELGWVALNGGLMLPENTIYVPPASDIAKYVTVQLPEGDERDVFKSTFNNGYTGVSRTVSMSKFPSARPIAMAEGNGDWYAYFFTSDGLSMNPGAYVMLASAKMTPNDMYLLENPSSQMGFVIRRLGNTIPFTDYEEMSETIR